MMSESHAEFFERISRMSQFDLMLEESKVLEASAPILPCKGCLDESRELSRNVLLTLSTMMNAVDRCEEHVRRHTKAARAPVKAPAPRKRKAQPEPVLREQSKRSRKPSMKVVEQMEQMEQKEVKKGAGKKVKFTCPSCSKTASSASCYCYGCEQWLHLKCAGLKAKEVPADWHCAKCI